MRKELAAGRRKREAKESGKDSSSSLKDESKEAPLSLEHKSDA
jgi:hypothetical protein